MTFMDINMVSAKLNTAREDCDKITKFSKTRFRYVSLAAVLTCQPQQVAMSAMQEPAAPQCLLKLLLF